MHDENCSDIFQFFLKRSDFFMTSILFFPCIFFIMYNPMNVQTLLCLEMVRPIDIRYSTQFNIQENRGKNCIEDVKPILAIPTKERENTKRTILTKSFLSLFWNDSFCDPIIPSIPEWKKQGISTTSPMPIFTVFLRMLSFGHIQTSSAHKKPNLHLISHMSQ
jgi:hypothetical protein